MVGMLAAALVGSLSCSGECARKAKWDAARPPHAPRHGGRQHVVVGGGRDGEPRCHGCGAVRSLHRLRHRPQERGGRRLAAVQRRKAKEEEQAQLHAHFALRVRYKEKKQLCLLFPTNLLFVKKIL